MNISDFYTGNALTSFISRLTALLGINDMSRVKVVGVVSGSVIVTTSILPSDAANESTTAQVQSTLTNNQQGIIAGLASGVGPVITVSSSYHADPSIITQSDTKDSNIGLIVGVVVGAVIVGVTVAFVFCYFLRKRAKIVEEIRQSEE